MVAPNLPTLPNLIDKCTTFDDRPIYKTAKKTAFSDNAAEGAAILGLKIAKLEGTKGYQKKINATEAQEEDLTKLAKYMKKMMAALLEEDK
ncbi:unnamed protein product [Lasius platythorax]|uniref:Uncharacterized protein n=1 Tax=Lasius platythorax TaxID=488582 RepID=A0AAV2NY50_9HYME